MLIIFAGFFLRILLSIYNVNHEVLPGSGTDALGFHFEAVEFKNYLILKDTTDINYEFRTGWWYSVFLGYLYFIFDTSSHVFSSILSCIFWLISALTLKSILVRLKINYIKINIALLFYTLLPTGLIYTSITLREVYMLCIINFIILLIIILKDKKKYFSIFVNIFMILIFFYLLTLLHRSNILFIILLFGSLVSYYLIIKINIGIKSLVVLSVIFISTFYYSGYMESFFESIKDYQIGHFHPYTVFRASYYEEQEIRLLNFNFINFFTYVLGNIYNYFIQPSIFRINSPIDVILALENFIRICMFFYIIAKLFRYPNNFFIFHILFLILILSEIPYSQATINWGTASRHHLQVFGLLIILFLYPLKKNK